MKPQTSPQLPPALRKARTREDISSSFPPIVPKTRPVPEPAPVVVGSSSPTAQPPQDSSPQGSGNPLPAPLVSSPPSVKPSTIPTTTSAPVVNVSQPAKPQVRPKPVFTGRPAVAQLEGKIVVFEGVFRHEENESFTTETKLTGNPKNDRQSLINLARAKYPTGRMELKSTRIFTRESASATTFAPGTTISQLFGDPGTPTEVSVEVGTVFFDGARCQIFIRSLRTRNAVTISLRQPTGGNINFSNHIQPNRLVKELHSIVKEVLGTNVRELVITLKEEKS